MAVTDARIQSVITGITTLFGYGLNTGGPGGTLILLHTCGLG
jgi:hypothetical protein